MPEALVSKRVGPAELLGTVAAVPLLGAVVALVAHVVARNAVDVDAVALDDGVVTSPTLSVVVVVLLANEANSSTAASPTYTTIPALSMSSLTTCIDK